jgi:uncharacterized protein
MSDQVMTDQVRCQTPIVDVDLHLDERASDLAQHCEMPWRRILEEPGGQPPWTIKDTSFPRLGDRPRAPEPARTPTDLLARLDALGTDVGLVLPGQLLKLGLVYTIDYAAALARAYNRWLAESWLGTTDRILGAILALHHDPEDAAREIDHWSSHRRFAAVVVPLAGVDPLWGDRRYDPIYAAAEAAGLPVIYHGYPGLMLPGRQQLVTPFDSDFDAEPIGHSLVSIATLTRIVGTGVLARYPKLEHVFLGAGISWYMHLFLRLDKEYLETRRDVPWYTDRISGYLRRLVSVGTPPMEGGNDPPALADVVRVSCGFDRVVYGSDWPRVHHDTPTRVAATLLDDETRQKVLGLNARALLRIDAKHNKML